MKPIARQRPSTNSGKARFNHTSFVTEARSLSGSECRINLFQKSLSPAERASFLSALYDGTIVVSAIYKVAKRFGFDGAMSGMYTHRRDPDSCQRCNRSQLVRKNK